MSSPSGASVSGASNASSWIHRSSASASASRSRRSASRTRAASAAICSAWRRTRSSGWARKRWKAARCRRGTPPRNGSTSRSMSRTACRRSSSSRPSFEHSLHRCRVWPRPENASFGRTRPHDQQKCPPRFPRFPTPRNVTTPYHADAADGVSAGASSPRGGNRALPCSRRRGTRAHGHARGPGTSSRAAGSSRSAPARRPSASVRPDP